ncbi:MAG: NAD(P)H-dependent oxidoreductase, partial [Solirubrobacteraceae bacterium]|nr:NAD(P)H-dependent oxidoreductase [Solirubrobacteraceae bacterium]
FAGASAAGAEPVQVDCGDGRVHGQLLEVIEQADVVLFAAPTYRGQVAWPLKALLDHIPQDRDGNSALRGKATGTLLTAASADHLLNRVPALTCDRRFLPTANTSRRRTSPGPVGATTSPVDRTARTLQRAFHF